MKVRKALFPLAIVFLLLSCSTGGGGDEDRVGLADPRFGTISAGWDSFVNSLDMHNYWLAYKGIDREGTNYFLLPKAAGSNTCSERFNPYSPYFQSWFGIYTVKDNARGTYGIKDGEVVVADIINLALADQMAWLVAYGVSDADMHVSVDPSMVYTVEDAVIDGNKGWRLRGKMNSNVDVGAANTTGISTLGTVQQAIWNGKVTSYQEAVLDGVFYVWYAPENQELNVAYYNGIEFTDAATRDHATFKTIEAKMEAMAAELTVYE